MVPFDIQPYVGGLPITFGMARATVHEVLGSPEDTYIDGKDVTDYWDSSNINIHYSKRGLVDHMGFSPGAFELRLLGTVLWSAKRHPDPNRQLLRQDPKPLESLGFLVFRQLGITTTGYHDDDEYQRALTIFPRGRWDRQLKEHSKRPDLRRYRARDARK
jgi:hypothetical protein